MQTNNNYFDFSVNHLFEERESQNIRVTTEKGDSGQDLHLRTQGGDSPTCHLSYALNKDEIAEQDQEESAEQIPTLDQDNLNEESDSEEDPFSIL